VKGNQTVLPASLATQAAQLAFAWDFDNKLKSSDIDNNGSADVTFEYDALGRRVARTQGSTAVVYFQADQQTLADYPRGGSASTATYRYVFGSYIDEPVVRKTTGTGGTVLYYHRNQQYSIYALTDSSSTVGERYAYTAYGQPTFLNASATVQTSSAAGNRYTYTAREWDSTLGLYHFRARWISGLTGRFLTRDPIGYRDGLSVYRFLRNQSLSARDPFGFATKKEICEAAVQEFINDNQAEFDKACGKDKYRFPWTLNPPKCELNSENGKCSKKKDTSGFHTCKDNGAWGDSVGATICVDNHSDPDEGKLKQKYKDTMGHEWVHLLDSCSCNNDCKNQSFNANDPEGKKKACDYVACSEIRAYSYVDCRDKPPGEFKACVIDGAKASVKSVGCDEGAVDALYDTCVVPQGTPVTFPPPVR
jgi:RHS repeat-associated protein